MPDPLKKSSRKWPKIPAAHTAKALRQISGSEGLFGVDFMSITLVQRAEGRRHAARKQRSAGNRVKRRAMNAHERVGAGDEADVIEIGRDAADNQHRSGETRQALRRRNAPSRRTSWHA